MLKKKTGGKRVNCFLYIVHRAPEKMSKMFAKKVSKEGAKGHLVRLWVETNLVVVGTKQRVQYLVEELRETQIVMKEITGQNMLGEFFHNNLCLS